MEFGTKQWVLVMLVLVSMTFQLTSSSSDQRNGVGSSSSRNKNKVKLNELSDIKEWKKLIKSKTNVLIAFVSERQSGSEILKTLVEVADLVQGLGTIAFVDCSSGESKKLCKKVKVNPSKGSPILKHYHNGDFNKDYDRAERVSSIVNFMKDPTGDIPWEEDPSAGNDILHLPDLSTLMKTVKREKSGGRGILVMFYAPWCGYCKKMKPDYATAAKELKDEAILAAIDVNRPENSGVRSKFNITGFPTLLYFRNGGMKSHYEGENTREAIISFMRNPDAPPVEKPKEAEWADEPSQVVHLTTESFDAFLQEHESVLIMFYAPWCGHCKTLKPRYTTAAQTMLDSQIQGKLAAVDATKETSLGKRFQVSGYPSVKYFRGGDFAFDVNVREEEAILEFMRNPNEPPPPPPPETPWSEEENSVVHLSEENFKSILKRKKHALVMFYAPWCGACKHAKPEFIAAAEENKDDPKVMFGALDCTAPTSKSICSTYEVTGFPTFKHFQYFNKEEVTTYDGPRTKTDLTNEVKGGTHQHRTYKDWDGIPGEENIHKLTDENMTAFLKSHESVLLMFYAPWCGHCKALKPDYARAAISLARDSPSAILAAIDCAQYPRTLERHQIQGYPTLKYYRNGNLYGEYNRGRRAGDIIAFMTTPPKKDEL